MRGASILSTILAAAFVVEEARATSSQPTREYEVKAAFVYGVMKFVEWPPSGLPPEGQPLTLAVLGRDAGPVVKATLQGQRIAGRSIRVLVLDRARDVPPCDVLFIADEATPEAREALSSVRGRPVLTVTETTSGPGSVAVIGMTVVGTKLAFDANLDAARENGLRLSSHLLHLARKTTGAILEKDSR